MPRPAKMSVVEPAEPVSTDEKAAALHDLLRAEFPLGTWITTEPFGMANYGYQDALRRVALALGETPDFPPHA